MNIPNRPPFPAVIDSSMRSDFVSCPRSFWWKYIQNQRRKGTSIHLHFGGAFAAGIAEYREKLYGAGANPREALLAGQKKIIQFWGDFPSIIESHPNKSLERCLGALEAYIDQYPPHQDHIEPLVENGHPRVEFNFALPLPVRHPQTGEPILYSGRFDMLAKMGQALYIEDDKTTSQLGPQWVKQWRIRAQFTGYVWGAREYGYRVEGAIVRGISLLKGGYGHAEVIEARPQWMIDQWHKQLVRDIERMKRCYDEGIWDQVFDSACGSYGGCAYLDLCASQNAAAWLQADFEHSPYDPLGVVE